MFIDYVRIHVKAGQGGSGCMSFHREKFVDKGGPDGGDGGKGGSIILKANKQLRTLRDYKYRSEYRVRHGQHGMGSNRHGRKTDDVLLEVPVGTIVKDEVSGELLADLIEDGQTFVAAKGGRGGKGNARFATPTHRSPREWEVGEAGEERWLALELKLIADIGFVGLPNAGKSTLLSRISAAKPKIADYPFTTLEPNLGIVNHRDYQNFVVADIPGLIEGAHEGKGLGHQFLRHIERTRILAYIIDCTDEDPGTTYKILRNELKSHSKLLVKKPSVIILTKLDIYQGDKKDLKFKTKLPVIKISAVSGENLSGLKDSLFELIQHTEKLEEEIIS
ncbi:MAG: GTPase ObgE [Calditrichaceae bacterium]